MCILDEFFFSFDSFKENNELDVISTKSTSEKYFKCLIYFDRVFFIFSAFVAVDRSLKTQWYIIFIFFALWNFIKFSGNKHTIQKKKHTTIKQKYE